MFQLSHIPLEHINLHEGLKTPQAGAFVSFEGWVRDHHQGQIVKALEYEAMQSLCCREAEKIINECKQSFSVIEVKVFHRVGKLQIGDMAVWIGVTAAHRDDAFKGCRFMIDEIKKRLPIWKKEYYLDRDAQWVNCQKSEEIPASSPSG